MRVTPVTFVATVAAVTTLPTLTSAVTLIRPTSATASSQFAPEYRPENAINGSGLPANFQPGDAHAPYASANGGNHWTTAAGTRPTDAWITFHFDTPQELGSLYLWNHRSTVPPAANAGYDLTRFILSFFSPDGRTHLFSLNDVHVLPNVATAQAVSFPRLGGVGQVRLTVLEVESSTSYTGLAEVAFDRGFTAGDANGDGAVDPDDFALIDRGRAAGLTGWSNGDFNADRTVDQKDYLIIDTAYLRQQGGTPSASLLALRESQFGAGYVSQLVASVPEPSSLACTFAGFSLLARRPRRN